MPAVTHIGLDVGSTSIRAVEVTVNKDRPVVTNFGQALLPDRAVVAGVVRDDRAVTAAVRQLWQIQKFRSKDVILGVSHQQVIVRDVEIPNVPAKERRQALPFLVRDVLPLPPEQALLDFYPLEDPAKGDTIVGLLVAAPKDAVIDAVRAVERAGIRVRGVDLAVFAALRSSALVADDTEAVIDIGASATNFVVHTDGIPRIVRNIARGSAEITALVANRMDMSLADGELWKCRVGLLSQENPEVAETVAEGLRPLIAEIRSSLDYYASSNSREGVSRLALVGGGSLLPGLIETLTEELRIPAYLSDPLQHVGDSRRGGRHDALGRFRSSAAVSIGLTLGAA